MTNQPPPATRRELNAVERSHRRALSRPTALSTARTFVAARRPASRPSVSPAPPRSTRRQVLSVLVIAFVVAVTVVTTIPINALLRPSDLAMAQSPEVLVTKLAPQEMEEVTGGADVAIGRDGYTVTEAVKQKVVQAQVSGGSRTMPQFVSNSTAAVRWPFPAPVPMSDQFGPRVLCDTCGVTMHRGADFLPGRGAAIYSIADGVVRYVEESDDGLGVHVIVDHRVNGELVSSVYCHMEFGSVAVSPGETIAVGQLIGTTGDTGFAFGPHLHFEIRLNGTDNVDPVAWLNANAG